MQKFELVISAEQREFLLTALDQCRLQNYFGADLADRDEIDALNDMLRDAIATESVEGGIVNNFTV